MKITKQTPRKLQRYYVRQLTMAEWEVGHETDTGKVILGYVHNDGHTYRATTLNGILGRAHAKKQAVEFIYANA